jgi:hypothetical protein
VAVRRKLLVCGALIAVIGVATSPKASAQLPAAGDAFVSFTSSATGQRVITVNTAPLFASTDISGTNGTITANAAVTTVTELLAQGANFSVNVKVCGPTDNGTSDSALEDATVQASGAACGTKANVLERYDDVQLSGSQLRLWSALGAAGATVPFGTVSQNTPTTEGAAVDMAAPVTLFSVSESPLAPAYNGVYTQTTSAKIVNLTTPGRWRGFWVATLAN